MCRICYHQATSNENCRLVKNTDVLSDRSWISSTVTDENCLTIIFPSCEKNLSEIIWSDCTFTWAKYAYLNQNGSNRHFIEWTKLRHPYISEYHLYLSMANRWPCPSGNFPDSHYSIWNSIFTLQLLRFPNYLQTVQTWKTHRILIPSINDLCDLENIEFFFTTNL